MPEEVDDRYTIRNFTLIWLEKAILAVLVGLSLGGVVIAFAALGLFFDVRSLNDLTNQNIAATLKNRNSGLENRAAICQLYVYFKQPLPPACLDPTVIHLYRH